ncbi:hypothetical protein OG369_16245 [Streptomyces sp. NBC_01221]|uniref:hypothetical protein n=1 Tax=Streptomyces sp. NBC_01221 TaxID=2903782 RepID=UPI0022502BFC|nr:hypothetical protein [Streptomyces sp. NBC_01221]MCX4787680.1 hypothetical protein [Streptomyces sp. NBC_01221]
MTHHDELRLLPWVSPEGRPCFLSADDSSGYLSRLADNTEAVQLGMGADLLKSASEVLSDSASTTSDLMALAGALTSALRDVLRVAESRGHRLSPVAGAVHSNDEDGPRLPAAAFG